MDLKTLLNEITKTAINQKVINYAAAGTDIYQLNARKIDAYPVLFVSPTGNHLVEQNTTTFEITLYYFDRLLEDNSNDIDIYSASIEQIKNLVRWIADIENVVSVADGYNITNFNETESFNDRIAGSYTTIQIEVINDTICGVL